MLNHAVILLLYPWSVLMRCMFCNHTILKKNDYLGQPITIVGRGIAHLMCAERDLISRRVFGSIHLSEVLLDDLYELREMVLAEINNREGVNNSGDLELF